MIFSNKLDSFRGEQSKIRPGEYFYFLGEGIRLMG